MTIVEREPQTETLTERERRARILEAAALEIEVRGWTTGMSCAPNGAVCLVGGIAAAVFGVPNNDDESYISAAETWGLGSDADSAAPLFNFNDRRWDYWGHPARTSADEVTFLLRWRAEEIRDGR